MRPYWFWPVFSMELRKVFAYRVDFWFTFLANTFIFFTISLLLWTSVFKFSQSTLIGGFTKEQMVFYFFLVPFFDRIVRSTEVFFLSHEIYEGGLTKYLLYPVSVLGFKFVGQFAHGAIGYLQFWAIFAIYLLLFPTPEGVHISLANTLMALAVMPIANAINFLILNIVEMMAFWVDNVWNLSVMARYLISLLSGYMIPVTLFPAGFQKILVFLPFKYLVSFPVRIMMGQVGIVEWTQGIAVLTFWLFVLLFLAQKVWKRGCLSYTGVGI